MSVPPEAAAALRLGEVPTMSTCFQSRTEPRPLVVLRAAGYVVATAVWAGRPIYGMSYWDRTWVPPGGSADQRQTLVGVLADDMERHTGVPFSLALNLVIRAVSRPAFHRRLAVVP